VEGKRGRMRPRETELRQCLNMKNSVFNGWGDAAHLQGK